MTKRHPAKPKRLSRVFQSYDSPLYFVTFCTWKRKRILNHALVHDAAQAYGRRNAEKGIATGRYVLMPDHVHLFLRFSPDCRLSETVRLLKRALSKPLGQLGHRLPHWQPGFFDHLLRTGESYTEKWHYVRDNPVRAGLVSRAEDWPYQGEIIRIDRV